MLDRARRRDDDVAGVVAGPVELPDALGGRRADRCHRPQDGAAERVVAEDVLGEDIEDEVVGRVVPESDLLEDDPALRGHVVGADGRLGDHVAEVVRRHLQVLVEHPAVDAGVLLAGEGVGLAADGVEHLGDVEGRVAVGPLEQQVFEKVRRAGKLRRLVTGPCPDPEPDGRRAHLGHGLGDNADAVGQNGTDDHDPGTVGVSRIYSPSGRGARSRSRPPSRLPSRRGPRGPPRPRSRSPPRPPRSPRSPPRSRGSPWA